MRRVSVFFPLLMLLLPRITVAQFSVADLPACSTKCFQSPSTLDNSTIILCQFPDKAAAKTSVLCLISSCTMQETLLVRKVEADVCGIKDADRSTMIKIVVFMLDSLAATMILIRLIHIRYLRSTWNWDDIVIAGAVPLLAVNMFLTSAMISHGFGKHIHELTDGDLQGILRYLFFAILFYITTLGIVKTSVLLFYLRLFPYDGFRKVVLASIAYVLLITILGASFAIVQCTPVANFWNKDIPGQCLDLTIMAYVHSSFAISSCILILISPIPVIARLNLGTTKKLGVIFMFAVGSFDCIIAIVRLQSILYYGATPDPSYDLVMITIWSVSESSIAVICACIPAMRRFFVQVFSNPTRKNSRASSDLEGSSLSTYFLKPLRRRNSRVKLGSERGDFIEPMVLQTHNVDLSTAEEFSEREEQKVVQHSWQEIMVVRHSSSLKLNQKDPLDLQLSQD